MPPLGKIDGYILAHKDKVERHPSPWEWACRRKRSLYRRLINWLAEWWVIVALIVILLVLLGVLEK